MWSSRLLVRQLWALETRGKVAVRRKTARVRGLPMAVRREVRAGEEGFRWQSGGKSARVKGASDGERCTMRRPLRAARLGSRLRLNQG